MIRIDRCDFGNCKNKPFAEVFPNLGTINKSGWSYLCYRHWCLEDDRLGDDLPWCSATVNFWTNLYFTFYELFKKEPHYPIKEEKNGQR